MQTNKYYNYLFFLLGLISGTFADCDYSASGCSCPSNTVGGIFCGAELTSSKNPTSDLNYCYSDIWQCAPKATSKCRYGPCTYGCCGTGDGKSYCCKDSACSGCPSGKWIKNRSSTLTYDRKKAADYAGQYCQNPNPEYHNYDGEGGDCTNFASQVLYAGGIPTDSVWYPYSYPWIRVIELYNYLTSHNLAKTCQLNELQPGDLIQYHNPQNGWHHTVIVVKAGTDPTVDYHSSFKCNVLHSYVKGNDNDKYRGLCIIDQLAGHNYYKITTYKLQHYNFAKNNYWWQA